VPVSRTGPIDFFRVGLDIAAVAAILFAFLRWSDARETAPREGEPPRYGDSIVDARTRVDPAIGLGPVNSEPPRH
jgi:hypothetical protein